MVFKVGDLVTHHVWDNHIFVITGFNQRDPKMPSWCSDSVKIEYLYSTNGENLPSYDKIRYPALRIFKSEYVTLMNDET